MYCVRYVYPTRVSDMCPTRHDSTFEVFVLASRDGFMQPLL